MVETKHPYLRSGCEAGKATQPIVPSQDSSPGYQSLGCGKDLTCGRGGKVNFAYLYLLYFGRNLSHQSHVLTKCSSQSTVTGIK